MCVHDVEFRIQPRFADRHMACLRQLRHFLVVEAGVDRRFRHPVGVDDAQRRAEPILQGTVIRYAAAIRARD